MFKKKYLIISLSIIVLILMATITVKNIHWSPSYDESICYNIPEKSFISPMDSVIEDCIGNIYITKDAKCSDDELIKETKCGDKSVFDTLSRENVINKIEKYRVVDNKIYVVGDLAVRKMVYGDGEEVLSYSFLRDGKDERVKFERREDIPRYIIVDTETSDINYFKDFSEMNEDNKRIFKDLVK